MAIDPKHAEAKADAKPDTAQADAEANREDGTGPSMAATGWTFGEIGRRYNACDDISDVSTEFWVALGMDAFITPELQMARFITYAHSKNLFHLKGEKGDPEKATELARHMGTTVDQLYRIVDKAVSQWSPIEKRISTGMEGEYDHESGVLSEDGSLPAPLSEIDDLPFDGDDLDVTATIKAVDETLEKEGKEDN